MSFKPDQPEGRSSRWKIKPKIYRKGQGPSRDASLSRSPTPTERPGTGFDKRKALGAAGAALNALKKASEVSDILGPLGLVCEALKLAVNTAEGVLKNEDDIKDLLSNLHQQSTFISEKTGPLTDARFRPSRASVQGLTKSLEEYTAELQELQGRLEELQRKDKGGMRRFWHKVISVEDDKGDIEGCNQRLNACFQRLKDSVLFFVADQNNEILDRLDHQLLNQLPYVDGAQGNQHSRCLPGTRELVLDEVMQWASRRDAKPIFALVDRAGTGKSTISIHMVEQWEEQRSLAGRFFFSKPKGITSGEHVATTIAKEMSNHTPFLHDLILKALNEHPMISGYKIEKRLEILVIKPLKELRAENEKALSQVRKEMGRKSFIAMVDLEKWHGNVRGRVAIDNLRTIYTDALRADKERKEAEYMKEVEATAMAYLKALESSLNVSPTIVLDALDECSNDDRARVLESFLHYIATFPADTAPFKLFFTCRPEEDVMSLLDEPSYLQRAQFSLYSKDVPSNQRDIELYTKSRLQHKLNAQQLSQFAAKADGLFIWASTAATFIANARNPEKIFNELTASILKEHPLDTLYDAILDDACQKVGKNELESLLEVLQLICVAREPLPVDVMDELLGLPSEPRSSVSGAFVAGLGSVVSDGSNGDPVQVLHPTFIEYLLRNQTSPRFSILKRDAHLLITEGCFSTLFGKQLCYDILNVIQPGVKAPNNKNIENLQQAIRLKVSRGLRYAAEYIIVHIMDCIGHKNVLQKLLLFFEEKLLFWIELMSYLEKVPILTNSIHVLTARLKSTLYHLNHEIVTEDLEWCNETLRMIQPFQASITNSALQVYYSALAFAPPGGKILVHYYDTFKALIAVVKQEARALKPAFIRLSGHTKSVKCLSFSSDGHKVASGSQDDTVRLWDAETGAAIGKPLSGHTHWVNCISFSPDDCKVASASADKTVRLWDVDTGEATGQPLSGHTDQVNCLLFSPNGRKIASGSDDGTVRLWDAETGTEIGQPLSGHTGAVKCLSFSPDGRKIASGSGDSTVRLWDADAGTSIGQPLSGHAGLINCLSFSPDGRRIASASVDGTLRLWDPDTGAVIGQPLSGHTKMVNSFSFSPDGRKIASGSDDGTVRLWDADTGTEIDQPLSGHTGAIKCLSFSPDGLKVASGSGDSTVRLWDTDTGTSIGQPLSGHAGSVNCLSFSPDGRRIASASVDRTLRLWDTDIDAALGKQLSGHTQMVYSLLFSPNGRKIASGSSDGTVRLWDAYTGSAIGQPLSGHAAPVNELCFSSNSRKIASASFDGTVRLWDTDTGAAIGQPLSGHRDPVDYLLFSPDGRRIASGSSDGTLRLWDADTGRNISLLPYHSKASSGSEAGLPVLSFEARDNSPFGQLSPIKCLSFSPDGRNFATGSEDYTVRLWDADTGVLTGQNLEFSNDIHSLKIFHVDANLFLTINNFHTYQISSEPPTLTPFKDLYLSILSSSTDHPSTDHPEASSSGQISCNGQWTTIHSKSYIEFCLPSHFYPIRWMVCRGRVAYGGEDGSIIIVDCTHLL